MRRALKRSVYSVCSNFRCEGLERRALLSGLIEFDPNDPRIDFTHTHDDTNPAELDHIHTEGEHFEEENIQGGWGSNTVTYGYSNLFTALDSDMTNGEIRDAIEESFLVWTSVAPLRFHEASDPGGTVNDNAHNVQIPQIRVGAHFIDGDSGTNVLAHARGPGAGLQGDMHFDTGNTYNRSGVGYFIQVSAHEIGHTIGISHANGDVVNDVCPPATPAIMDACINSVYDSFDDSFLYVSDINAVQGLYGTGLGYLLELDGTLHVSGTQASDTFHVSVSGNNLTVSSNSYGSFTRSLTGVTGVELHMRGGNDTVWVDSLDGGELFIDAGDGNDVFQIGNGDFDNNINAPILIGGGNGNDQIVVNDLTDGASGDVYTFDYGFQFSKPGTDLLRFPSEVEVFSVNGSGNSDTFVINQVPAGMEYNLYGWAGNDVFNVGVSDFDFAIGGNLNIVGVAGTDTININDSDDTGNDTYTITNNTFNKTGEAFTLEYATIETFNLVGQSGDYNNTFELDGGSNAATYNIDAGPGDDTFNFGNGDLDTNMPDTTWNLDGQTGLDQLNYQDTADAGDTDEYAISGAQIVKTGGGVTTRVNITSMSYLDFFASSGATEISVNQLNQQTTIHGGAGADRIELWDSYNITVPFPLAYSTVVESGSGLDDVLVNPDGTGDFVYATFDGNETLDALTISAGGHVNVAQNGSRVLDVQSLTLGGRINLQDNTFIDRNWGAGSQAFYTSRLLKGYNGGAWNGEQASIYSSVADNDSNHGLGISTALEAQMGSVHGIPLATTDLVIRYTLYGDTNLDRNVNFNDLLRVAQNYNLAGTWSKGDSNYNGSVNFEDVLKLAQNYGHSAVTSFARAVIPRSSILNSLEDDKLFGLM